MPALTPAFDALCEAYPATRTENLGGGILGLLVPLAGARYALVTPDESCWGVDGLEYWLVGVYDDSDEGAYGDTGALDYESVEACQLVETLTLMLSRIT